MKKNILIVLLSLNSSFFFLASAQQYSQLWGKKGESWNKELMPDFTQAGYKKGKKEIPHFDSEISVKDFGAVGDGVTDNTIAFRKAIAKCRKNQAVFIPAGIYLLKDTLHISKNKMCIRGENKQQTVLYFEKGLEELYPDYNKQYPNQTNWSWKGGMILFSGDISDIGIENITIKFPDNPWAGHDFHERGYNGIAFENKAHDGWVKDVTITGADVGIYIGNAHHITVENWVLDFGENRLGGKLNGHHGVNICGPYNLLQNFEIKGKFIHDLSIETASSHHNVFRNGKGTDLCIDHHNHDQRNNLFTNLNVGKGTRLYVSGGKTSPWGLSFNETYWNITADVPMQYCNQFDEERKHSTNNICVGIKTNLPSVLPDQFGNRFETIDPAVLYPQDLYLAQMKKNGKSAK
ncbi:glycosyl hydrolase family 28-related protein [Flavobacterium sp. WC2509]|uniref:glycosyl hydrolase family 28-related protein n=1 Tax=Flavobacterium sp. WC2509 TaxID=3461406 RepID=UPI004043C3F8